MCNIFFDLDGTLIESRHRLYKLFQYMVPESKLTFDEYWIYKRNRIPHHTILQDVFSYTLEDVKKFEKIWLERIELSEWLSLDEPFDGITECLKKLKNTHNLFIVTARQSEKMALEQIGKFGWLKIVTNVFVTGQTEEKYDIVKRAVNLHPNDWFVGDTGKDIETGKKLGIQTAAVLSGFLSKEKLLEYKPDIIEKNVTRLKF
jgi:phosphoglycolate phosphatase